MSDILNKAKDTLVSAYSSGQPAAALPPGFTDILLDLAIGLFSKCLAGGTRPAGVKLQVRNRPLIARIMVRRAVAEKLREEHGFGGYRHFQGDRMVEALLDAAGGAGDSDLNEFAVAIAQL